MWPSGLPDRKGKIRVLAPGRALAFADDPAWDDELAALGQRDGPAPPLIMDGLVDVLRRWSRSWERPVAVVSMPSRRYPTLVRSVAEHIAAVGRLPLVHALTISGPPPAVDAASAVRAKDLLVDNTIRTRWTATVAAALLADAGATSVLPLAIHQLP